MDMSDIIRNLRKQNNMTQEELAHKVGLQKSAIAKYENGRVENMKRSVIQDMANALGVTPPYLMGWENESNKFDEILGKSKDSSKMQKRTLEAVHTYFNDEMYQILNIMKNFDIETQKELLKRAKELELLNNIKE